MAAKTIVMRTPEDVLTGLPVMFGFHPVESVCVLGVQGRQMHARVDLPETAEDRGEAATRLTDALVRNGVSAVLVVSYSAEGERVAAMGVDLEVSLLGAGVAVLDHLWVSEGRWRRAGANGFEPAEGVLFEVASHPLMAEVVFSGRLAPAASREALVASLVGEPDPLDPLREAVLALGGLDTPESMAAEARWMQARVRGFLEDGERLDVADAARLMAGLLVVRLRDVVWAEITRRTGEAMVDLLSDLTRRAQGRAVLPVAALLAFAAWQAGQGALAWCAVDRAQAVDPAYSLAGLVAATLEAAMPPQEWPGIEPGDLPVLGGDAETV